MLVEPSMPTMHLWLASDGDNTALLRAIACIRCGSSNCHQSGDERLVGVQHLATRWRTGRARGERGRRCGGRWCRHGHDLAGGAVQQQRVGGGVAGGAEVQAVEAWAGRRCSSCTVLSV